MSSLTAAALRRLAERTRLSKARYDANRAARNARIYDANVGRVMTQADICRATDLTREHIARIIGAEKERREKLEATAAPGDETTEEDRKP